MDCGDFLRPQRTALSEEEVDEELCELGEGVRVRGKGDLTVEGENDWVQTGHQLSG